MIVIGIGVPTGIATIAAAVHQLWRRNKKKHPQASSEAGTPGVEEKLVSMG